MVRQPNTCWRVAGYGAKAAFIAGCAIVAFGAVVAGSGLWLLAACAGAVWMYRVPADEATELAWAVAMGAYLARWAL